MTRFLEKYRKEIVPEYMKKFNFKSPYQVPKIQKIVISIGLGQQFQDAKILEGILAGIAKITGQRPVLRRAKKAVSGFKLRKGTPCGCMVTLRKAKMYEFFDRLISVAIPRIRDFQGLPNNSFDEGGNYTFGITEQSIFPEVDVDKVSAVHGMNITIVTNSGSREKSYSLLQMFGFPFKKQRSSRG